MRYAANMLLIFCIGVFFSGCAVWHSGIQPVDPPGKKMIPAPTVTSNQPTLVWEPLKLKDQAAAGDLHYQLVVFHYEGFSLSPTIAYDKNGITETSHTLETPLKSDTQYYWRLRALYNKDGKQVATDWNGFNFVGIIPPYFGWETGKPYFFKTP